MNPAPPPAQAVMHVVPANGGGVDRFVRDLCRLRPDDGIVHVTESQLVLEWPGRPAYVPLGAAFLTDLALAGTLGRPAVLHAHSTTLAVRQFCQTFGAAARVPYVVTLHDVGFADSAADSFEKAQRLRFASQAAARTAPSNYIVQLAQRTLGERATCQWVENGVDPWPDALKPTSAPASLAHNPAGPFVVAVLGAIGEHKGLDALLAVAELLPPAIRIVIIGYTAQRLLPGWVVPGRVWMHGVFEPNELPFLVRHYGVHWAWFPPGMPESYSYALSDAWQAGLPAGVPNHGALAERVRRHGGGRVYPPTMPTSALAALIAQWLAAGAMHAPAADSGALQPVQQMTDAMSEIYRQVGGEVAAQPADETALALLAQQQLDTRFFRKELLNLQGQLMELGRRHEERAERLVQLEASLARESQVSEQWRQNGTELQRLLAELRAQLSRQAFARDVLASEQAELQARHAELLQRHDVLEQRHRRLTQRLSTPLRWLPAAWRERLVSLGRRWLI